jgi:hypothetical protein
LLGFASVPVLVLTLGCGGDSRRDRPPADGEGEAGSPGNIGSGGEAGAGRAPDVAGAAGAGLTSSDGGTGGAEEAVDACLDATTPPEAPLRRLRNFEYNNTVREWGDTSEPANLFPPDIAGEFYVSSLHVEQYFEAARDFAERVTADDASVLEFTGCDPAVDGEAACRQAFVREFIGRAFRRPATAEDIADFEAVFDKGQELGGDFASGVRAVVEVAQQAPEFLYRVELGEPLGDDAVEGRRVGWARPTPYEMATRLSYFLWGAPPDSALLEAAEQGRLRNKDEIESEARRMLEDERARATVRRFYFDMLDIRSSSELGSLDPEIAPLAVAETERFIDDVTWGEPGDFSSLLTAPFTFVNEPLAQFYGIAGVSGDAFQRVELDPTRRAGILTHASVLASTSYAERTSPTRRGLLVLVNLLCADVPTPPDGVVVPPVEPMPGATTRQLLESATADPVCRACHALIDPLGFAFEQYDGAGRFRDTENGHPIDATGSHEIDGSIVQFDGALELSALLAGSSQARQCLAENWMRFAHDRALTAADSCSRQTLGEAFAAANGNVRELLVALTQTDAFLYRPASPEQP